MQPDLVFVSFCPGIPPRSLGPTRTWSQTKQTISLLFCILLCKNSKNSACRAFSSSFPTSGIWTDLITVTAHFRNLFLEDRERPHYYRYFDNLPSVNEMTTSPSPAGAGDSAASASTSSSTTLLPICGFCQKCWDQEEDMSKWRKIRDTSILQKFWCELHSLRGTNDKSFAKNKSCKLCEICNDLWKQWVKTVQTFDRLKVRKESLLGKLSKRIPSASSFSFGKSMSYMSTKWTFEGSSSTSTGSSSVLMKADDNILKVLQTSWM
jgi:hypothetical protein